MSRLVVLCVDSLFTTDLKDVQKLKGFQTILENSRIAGDITCIYPTLTYPCHATVMSGMYPDRHGISHNEKLNPACGNHEWFWHYRDLQAKTVFDYARENGLRTGAVLWPVTAAAPIDYLIPEIWTLSPQENPDTVFLPNISPAVKEIYEKNKNMLDWKTNPDFDRFGTQCAVDIIHEFKPEVLFLHQATLDHVRHRFGVHSAEVQEALKLHDNWIQMLIDALREEGLFEETAFIILGDHGHLRVDHNISTNLLLKEAGFIQTDEEGQIVSWQAYAQSCGISTQVFVKDPADNEKVLQILKKLEREGYVQNIFTRSQTEKQYHLTGQFAFVAEAADGYAFSNQIGKDLIVPTDSEDYKFSVSTHGHLPHRGEKPCFIMHGKGINPGEVIGAGLIDEAPTFLDLLHIPAQGLAGKSLL